MVAIESPPDPSKLQSFADYLTATNGGQTNELLTEELFNLVEAVLITKRSGTITLVVKVESGGPNTRRVRISENVTAKAPKIPPRTSDFWADNVRELVTSNPDQPALPAAELA